MISPPGRRKPDLRDKKMKKEWEAGVIYVRRYSVVMSRGAKNKKGFAIGKGNR